MTAALAIRDGLPGRKLENAYILPPDLTLEEWGRIIRLVDHIASASQWWLADAMVYGEDTWGEECSEALPGPDEDPLGISQSRMKQAAWMARVYPPGTRVPEASWTHHRIVAELPPVDRRDLLGQVAQAVKDVADGVEGAKLISTRELGTRKKRREDALKGHAVAVDGTPLAGDDLGWVPTRADLAPECRRQLEIKLSEMSARHRVGFESGWLHGHLEANALGCFEREGE